MNVRIAVEVDEDEVGRDVIQLVEEMGVRKSVGILIEAGHPVMPGIRTQMTAGLIQGGPDLRDATERLGAA